jgi:hypothetical protein
MFPVQNMFFPFFFDAPAIVFVGIWFLMGWANASRLRPDPESLGGRTSGASLRACFSEVCWSCQSASIDLTTLTNASLVSTDGTALADG